jgi:hypothetical protein
LSRSSYLKPPALPEVTDINAVCADANFSHPPIKPAPLGPSSQPERQIQNRSKLRAVKNPTAEAYTAGKAVWKTLERGPVALEAPQVWNGSEERQQEAELER